MRFTSFLLAAIAPFALAAPMNAERSLSAVVSSIDSITAKVNVVASACVSLKVGDLKVALSVGAALDDVNAAVDAATAIIAKAEALTLAESKIVVAKVEAELAVAISAALDALAKGKTALESVVSGLVNVLLLTKAKLEAEEKKLIALSAALVQKLEKTLQSVEISASAGITAKFDATLASL
jgi:hypothetical protein